jgi:flagellar hook protein FlgE
MLRSLYSGISGLNANAVEMDVVGNNIANANTVGYKSSRVTFREMLTQNLSGASRPVSGQRGGINAMQIGLGSSVGTIDTRFQQGALQSTGLVSDLALQGDGFFMLSDGVGTSYTRAGAFGLDGENYMVDPGSGLRLQGVMAGADGTVTAGSWTDIHIDPSMTVPAMPTDTVQLYGNLDVDSEAQGSILESNHMMAAASGTDLLTSMYAQDGDAMSLQDSDRIAMTGMVDTGAGAVSLDIPPFVIGSTTPGEGGTTLDELVTWIEDQIAAMPEFNPGEVTVTLEANGSLTLANASGAASLMNLQLSVPGNSDFNGTFNFSNTIDPGGTGTTADTTTQGEIRAAATSDDLLTAVFNSRGESLGLNVDLLNPQTTLTIDGTVGASEAPSYDLVVDDTTTVEDFMTGLQIAFGVSSDPVSIDGNGEIIIRGDIGTENALGQVDIREVGEVNPTLETSFDFVQTQQADDGQEFTMASTVYDSLGNTHNVRFNFTKRVGLNEWAWTAEMEGNEVITEGGNGTVSFTENGEVIAFRYADDAGQMSFTPQATGAQGAETVSFQIDAGQLGEFNGLSQFSAPSDLQSLANGYPPGDLLDFEISTDGTIIGRFSNDTMQTLARVGIARFANNEGLLKAEGNTYQLSSNSGEALTSFAGNNVGTMVISGALEGSNVDLTAELTNLVIAQRAFQANARVVTTGDQILQEIVSMVR